MAELVIKLVNGELAGKTMQEINKQVREAAKELSKAKAGTEEFVKATQKLEQAKGLQADMKKQIEGTASASDMLKKSWNSLPGAQFFNQIGDSIGMMRGGVGGLVSQFGVLKTAIAATGLGLLVIVIGSVINYLSKLESVTNIVKGAWDGLTAAFNVFTKAVATWDFSDLDTKMATAAKEAYNLVDAFDALEDKARDLDLSNAEAGKTIDQLLLKSKNVSLSYAERLAILDEVSKVENEQHKKRIEYANEYLATVQREVDNAERQNEANDELKDKLVAAKKAVIEADRETLVLQEKIENRRMALLEKQQAEREKEAARREKENEKFLKEQEKFYAEQDKKEMDHEQMRESRKEADAKREKQRVMDGMAAAAAAIAERIRLNEQEAESVRKLQELKMFAHQEQMNIFNEGINTLVAVLSADMQARKRNADAIKAFTIGQIQVNLMDEIQGIWANANKSPTNILFPGSGNLIAGLKTGFAVARATMASLRVANQKFATGGEIKGPSHTWGGVPVEAEGGEFIFSRKAVNAIGVNVLDSINRRLTFADGGMVPKNPFSTSSALTTSSAAAGGAALMPEFDYAKLAAIISGNMKNEIYKIKVVNNLQETKEGISTLNSLRDKWDV